MIHELHDLLYRAGARLRSLRLWTSLALCWLFWAAVVYSVARFASPGGRDWSTVWSVLAGATLVTALVCWRVASRAGRDPRLMARRIEQAHPELGAMLLAALEQAPSPRFKRLGYLQTAVVKGAVSHGRQHNWADATSIGRLRFAKVANLAALVALVSASMMLVDRTGGGARASSSPTTDDALPLGASYEVMVQPGDAEIERGATLLVIARFRGALPPDAELAVEPSILKPHDVAGGTAVATDAVAEQTVRDMTRSLDDPQYVGRVPAVVSDLTYHVQFAGQRSPTYRISVFDYPELVRADADLQYPDYTHLEPKVVEDVRQVTAVEGTQLTLTFRLNKDVATARLVDRDGEERTLTRVEGADPLYQIAYALERSQRFKLHLVDREGRKNKLPPEFVVGVTANRPPEIKIERPGHDVRVSPVEELQVNGAITDDFGMTGYGLSFSLGGEEPREATLAESKAQAGAEPIKKQQLAELIDFEALAAKPDQLVSYFIWAEDMGPDGKPRRTLSDMYFAEVRPFDEVFRQGEQPTQQQQQEQQQQQGQQGAGQQAEQLAELQKQIVGATWKLLRRETGDQPTAEFAADAAAVAESQQQAIDQLSELAGQLNDDQSQEFVEQAHGFMDKVQEQMAAAAADGELKPLRPALSAGQSAYQALLKLKTRQFDVSQSNQGQPGQSGATSGANSASQRQLQQLELSADENRYETQSRAQSAANQNAQQLDESRQILNRLRELARRQQDLNERLRELQSALQAAETEAEKQQLERQLKRLRDQQREILRDTESLDNDVQNSPNGEQLREAAQQLDQTRSRVQDASQALDEGQVSQALAEGARAEDELNELRDDFRKRTAERFTDEMKDLRDAARQLDERQQQLSQELSELNADNRRTLRESGPREELVGGLQQQQQELGETLERMRDTVTEAEEPEPLLAGELFDAVQQVGQERTEEGLDMARQLVEAGVTSEAGDAMRQADRGIAELRQRVDRAAESVLGDETETLRRANEQLEQLADELNQEIQNAQGQRPGAAAEQPAEQDGTERGGQPGQQSEQAHGEGDEQREQQGQQGSGRSQEQEPGAEQRGRQLGGQPAESPEAQSGAQPGEQQGSNLGAAQGEQNSEEQTPQGGRDGGPSGASGEQTGEPRARENSEQPDGDRPGATRNNGGGGRGGNARGGALEKLGDLVSGANQSRGPSTGGDFRSWSERMRAVEDMLDDPKLSAEAARIRDRAEEARADYKRYSRSPDWNKLVEMVADPLNELRGKIDEEIRRKASPDSLVPIDRDAAPPDFADKVRLYYQRLGSGE
jgi:hypothetical protein